MDGTLLWQRTAQLTVSKSQAGSIQLPYDPTNPNARTGVDAGSPLAIATAASQVIVLDLSQLRFTFVLRGESSVETPNTLVARIYNLKDQTANEIIGECDQINLQVGYVNGPAGVIFSGEIKQFKKGGESAVDTFLEISAADGDHGYNFGFVNKTFAAGSSATDVLQECAKQMQCSVNPTALDFTNNSGVLFPRGQVKFNLARVILRELTETLGARWFLSGGVLYLIPNTSYLAGEVVVLGPTTGLVGFPETTDNGISVKCLLNPLLKIGTAVQIDPQLIVNKTIIGQGLETYQSIDYTSNVGTGLFRILSMDGSGDSRGNDWTYDLVCLAVEQTNTAAGAVTLTGAGKGTVLLNP